MNNVNSARDLFAYVAAGTMLLLVVFFAIDEWARLPVVYESYSTRECVRIENGPGGTYTCGRLPDRYLHRWVE